MCDCGCVWLRVVCKCSCLRKYVSRHGCTAGFYNVCFKYLYAMFTCKCTLFHIVGFLTRGIWIPAVMDITGVMLPFKNRNIIILFFFCNVNNKILYLISFD